MSSFARLKLGYVGIGVICGIAAVAAVFVAGHINTAKASSWTGCYGGAGAGYGATVTDTSVRKVDDEGTSDPIGSVNGFGTDGYALALLAGCDVQVAPKFVLGVWGDYTWHQDQDFDITIYGDNVAHASLEKSWAIGGRAGYLVTPDAMAYVLAGYTQADLSSITIDQDFGVATPTLDGIVVGAGAELSLGKGFFLQTQYTYTMLDDASIFLWEHCNKDLFLDLDPNIHTGRVGLVYKFNFDGSGPSMLAASPLK